MRDNIAWVLKTIKLNDDILLVQLGTVIATQKAATVQSVSGRDV